VLEVLLLLAVLCVAALVVRALRSRTSSSGDPAAHARARAHKAAAEQAIIGRQGGQGAGQGGVGGGMGF
jgi:hypothetical protein